MSSAAFTIRPATRSDIAILEALVERSIRGLAAGHYDSDQIDSSLRYLYGIDSQLVDDGTYLVVEHDRDVVACGGWSWRRTPFGSDRAAEVRDAAHREPGKDAAVIRAFYVEPHWTHRGVGRLILDACERAARAGGFDRYELTSTAMGVAFYATCGYREIEPVDVTLPDGVVLPHVYMIKT
jgi:GNAT superfamily N-acetyltransferase